MELGDLRSLRSAFRPLSPRVVINAAAYNHVDQAEEHPQKAFVTNAFALRHLGELCHEQGSTLVHFSSDYVFGLEEQRREPYEEVETPGPVNMYGLSKLAGEYAVRFTCPRHFIVRTCGLYGLHGTGGKGRNFVETMLALGYQRREVRVVRDQICTPTNTLDLAEATIRLLRTDAFGLYHWTNSGECTWYEFACEVFRQAKLHVECTAVTAQEFGSSVVRPSYSVLDTAKLVELGLGSPRHWKEALQSYLDMRKR